jgi:hypothetical protein
MKRFFAWITYKINHISFMNGYDIGYEEGLEQGINDAIIAYESGDIENYGRKI